MVDPQALLQLPYVDTLYGYSLKLLRYADTTTLASLVRADWTFYSSHPALFLSTYLANGLLVDYFEKKRRCGSQDDNTTNLEWLTSLWEWYTSYLLHPITSLQQVPSDHSDWEDDPNFLFEHLSFPDLWLHPLVNMDYIKALPTWRFIMVGQHRSEESDVNLSEKTDDLHLDKESLKEPNPPLAGPSNSPHNCKRLMILSNEGSNNQISVCNIITNSASESSCYSHGTGCSPSTGKGLDVCCLTSEGFFKHKHCDWEVWPCNMLQCSECVVCLENFVTEELLMGLPCGHAFHKQCIVVWLTAGRHCCPVCRWPSYKKKQQKAAQSSSAKKCSRTDE